MDIFSEKDIQMVNKQTKRYSTIISHQRNANQIIHHFTNTSMTRIKKGNKCWSGGGELEPSYIAGGNVKR